MEYIADSFFKEYVIIYSFKAIHGRPNVGNGDWFIYRDNNGLSEFLWEDGTWHDCMSDINDVYHYFLTEQDARNCVNKFGYYIRNVMWDHNTGWFVKVP